LAPTIAKRVTEMRKGKKWKGNAKLLNI
jgi:hypothetical protein